MSINISERNRKWKLKHSIDFNRFKAVIFESDDWGACEFSKDIHTMNDVAKIISSSSFAANTLEKSQDLERLYKTLEKFSGCDGIPANFTAFMCVGNPDYKAIAEAKYSKYYDVGADTGFPCGWGREGLQDKWRQGVKRGVFHPEFHANLHHSNPKLWLKKLNEDSPAGEHYRSLFKLQSYMNSEHLPEYEDMNLREQNKWVKTGISRFENIFGFTPSCGVTSDATPLTEIVWASHGIRVVCLKNSRINCGVVVAYDTKPWNNQNIYTPMGAYNDLYDVVYLTRNVYFESEEAQEVLPVINNRWKTFNEPAVICTHRCQYVSLDSGVTERGFKKLENLLSALTSQKGVRFLNSKELGELYYRGWSIRTLQNGDILRKWSKNAEPIILDCTKTVCRSLEDGKLYKGIKDGKSILFELPLGDYIIENKI